MSHDETHDNDEIADDICYLDLHGNRVAYRDAGSGEEVVLLVHGMAGSSESWEPVLSLLAQSHRVVAPDLLGHGLSAKPRTDYSLGAFAAGLRDLLDELGISKATVVGHSLGGGVAMQFAYQHPEYCQRLILLSSGGLGPDVGWILRLLSVPGAEFLLPVLAPPPVLGIGDRVRTWLGAMGFDSPRGTEIWRGYSTLADRPTRQAFMRTLRSVIDYRGQAVSGLSRLHLRPEVPMLLIWGEKDQIIPVGHGYQAQAARSGSQLEILPGVGHFPQIEAPAMVADVIGDFINQTVEPERTPDIEPLPASESESLALGLNRAASLNDLVNRRVIVHRAVGMLISRAGLSAEDALAHLHDLSQTGGIGIEESARRVIAAAVRDATRC